MNSYSYARYVPPPKSKISESIRDSTSSQPISSSKSVITCDTYHDASASYARYLPSKPISNGANSAPKFDRNSSPSSSLAKIGTRSLKPEEGPLPNIKSMNAPLSRKSPTQQGRSPSDQISSKSKRYVKTFKYDNNAQVIMDNQAYSEPSIDINKLNRNKNNSNPDQRTKFHQEGLKSPSKSGSPPSGTYHQNKSEPSATIEQGKFSKLDLQNVGSINVKKRARDELDSGDEKSTKSHNKILKKREKSLKKIKAKEDASKGLPLMEPSTKVSVELHDLVPLPQAELLPPATLVSIADSYPPWMANPTHVTTQKKVSFKELGLENHTIKVLQEKGFNEAFAIQAAVLPLLISNTERERGDIVISAATGSGKTLAYTLPMIKDISYHKITKLRGLIILPTRELVFQVKEMAETCVTAFYHNKKKRVKIGTAVGNESLSVEQFHLIDYDQKYDPEEYSKRLNRIDLAWKSAEDVDDGFHSIFEESCTGQFPDHISYQKVNVDILICTPGRLVEHMKCTSGFSLKDVSWLVIDEADKLLDQSFQQWLPLVMAEVESKHTEPLVKRRRVQKLILSATMTRDLGELAQLKLYRPKLITLDSEMEIDGDSQTHNLPCTLWESGVKVEEDGIKPLYLMEILKRESVMSIADLEDSYPSDTDSLDSSLDSETSDSSTSVSKERSTSKVLSLSPDSNSNSPQGVLIFTNSNVTAVRLGRIIPLLCPNLATRIGVLTSSLPRSSRQQCIRSFCKGIISVIVASDLVSRGLDLPNLAHVINYDIPTSVVSYIHRVGRTARAGKEGRAWTLFTATEGRWFWNEIGRSAHIHRPKGKIVRTNISKETFSEEQRRTYGLALETLEKEATGVEICKWT
ncbi:BgTH12-05498 [Blumeria graminis f. sp. triticale]|uniref:ATP-dependent RNA helicase n=1 Tax=Blumeria graminis f. sp. triticale TaxID=1689686 RepID=A0A9W4GGD8_BLUGR|nr:BgTH12-05498 [Blumeria graminis f. sp. triticale]